MDIKSLISRINGLIRGVKFFTCGIDRDLTDFSMSLVPGFFSLYCRWINVRPRMSISVCLSLNSNWMASVNQLMLRLPSIIPSDPEDRARIVTGNNNTVMISTTVINIIPERSQIISIMIGFNWSRFHRFFPYFSLPSSICIFPSFPALSQWAGTMHLFLWCWIPGHPLASPQGKPRVE